MYSTKRFSRACALVHLSAGCLLTLLFGASSAWAATPAPGFAISPLETRVLGQNAWLQGGPAALRVIVTDHETGRPVEASVKIALTRDVPHKAATRTLLFDGRTNGLGTLSAKFRVPRVILGAYQLAVDVDTPLGTDTVTQPVTVQTAQQILLTCDKPVYQPGQVIHIRALALDAATRQAVHGIPVTFEVEDARANKVFKEKATLSQYGVAAAYFTLADEVNMGTFTLRAVLPSGDAEKKVQVERYVLPKYKISVTTDKSYYLPGETVDGIVKASYFFGKPVANGDVTVAVNTIDIGVTKLNELSGRTDDAGVYKFSYTLPASFVGQPFEQGKAVAEFAVTLKDTANHQQEASTSVPVVQSPISLAIVPESANPVLGITNHVTIAAAAPDGQPLENTLLMVDARQNGRTGQTAMVKTDSLGLAIYAYTPEANQVAVHVEAQDSDAHTASAETGVTSTSGGLILRADETLATVGDTVHFAALSSVKRGTLYLDVIRDKQTILTQATDLHNGEGFFTLPVTPDMAGTLEIHAYTILPNEDIIRDTRVLIVSPANDLHIGITADQTEYKPGGEADLHFLVQDGNGRPVSSAIGLAIVDESVFALSELKPGLEQIYFTLEKELMDPKYEIHGLSPAGLLEPRPMDRDDVAGKAARQRAAAMLLAAAPAQTDFDYKLDSYQVRSDQMRQKATDYIDKAAQRVTAALYRYQQKTHLTLSVDKSLYHLVELGYLKPGDLLDPWGSPYKSQTYGQQTYQNYVYLSSAGPDGKWNTSDDIQGIGGYTANGFGRLKGAMNGAEFVVDGVAVEHRPMIPMETAGAVAFDRAVPAPMAMAAGAPVNAFAGALRPQGVDNIVANTADNSLMVNLGAAAPRVRSYFPETMLWNPALITDANGRADLTVPLADSITTWRVSAFANSALGQLGSTEAPLRVFQEFFVDLDLPLALTQNDNVQVPVTVYNYLPTAQDVTLNLEKQPWFTLQGAAIQTIHVEANQVTVVYYPIVVNQIGHFPLTVTAKGTKLSDAVRRVVDVLPDGKEIRTAINDRLDGEVTKTVAIPADAIADASNVWVKFYPGTFSQVVEGLDGILQMPNGCFEQTSSTTYPDVLVLNYLKQTKHVNPELSLKAEQYINIGYQRLVTFETHSGGFSWFGSEPANQVLTAYGLLEFSDMAQVHDVDPNLIHRTQGWLASKQRADGTWLETGQGIAEGIINRQTGELRTTAYVVWALAESGYTGGALVRGESYLKGHLAEAKDPYTLAVLLNALGRIEPQGDATREVADRLTGLAKTTDKTAYWTSDTQTFTGANGHGADLETTGLATYALVQYGHSAGFLTKALTYLVQSKDSYGTWESTQGTVWSLKALLYASKNASVGGKGTVNVIANGQAAATFTLTPDNSDVMRQIDLSKYAQNGANTIQLRYQGDGSLLYQIVGRYYLPWSDVPQAQDDQGPLSITVAYDKTTLAQDDTATVTATIHNTTNKTAEMPLIDLGVPPGFDVQTEKLDALVQSNTIDKYTVAARQVIVYLTQLAPDQTVTVTYQVKARFPIKTRTPLSKTYPYYDPERVSVAQPIAIVAQK